MENWSFLTNHGQALLCIAKDPGTRLRDIADALQITERRAQGIVTDLTEAGYVKKGREGRRNRYEVLAHLPLRAAVGPDLTVGELLNLFVEPSSTLSRETS